MKLFNWFRRHKVRIAVIPSTRLRLADWTGSPELVQSAQRLFNTHELQTIFAIMRNESPASYGLPMGASHDDHVAHAYKVEGYNLAMNTLEAFTTHQRKKNALEATFEPEPKHSVPAEYAPDINEDLPPVNRISSQMP